MFNKSLRGYNFIQDCEVITLKIGANYAQIASGSQLTTAAQNPAGISIAETLKSQVKGDQQGIQNIESSTDLLKTADGAYSSILNDLGRVRELAVQSQNGTMTADDRAIINNEISSLFDNIQSTAQNTSFNTKKLLDGSFSNQQMGVGANGQGQTMSLQDASLSTIGIDPNNFTLDDIDSAIETVSEARSQVGAQTNGLESNLSNTHYSLFNQEQSRSTVEDADMAKAIMDLKKQTVLNQYKNLVEMKKAEKEEGQLGLLL